jgi:hypothetical protein
VDSDSDIVSGTADVGFITVWIDNSDVWRNEAVTGARGPRILAFPATSQARKRLRI